MSPRLLLVTPALCLALAPAVLAPAARAADPGVAATVGSRKITLEEVDRVAAARLAKVRSDEYDARRGALDNLINQTLLEEAAKAAKQTPDQWLAAQIDKRVKPPTDAEVEALYNQARPRLGGQTLEQAKPGLVDNLQQQQRQKLRQEVLAELRQKASVKVELQPPRTQVPEGGNPSRGPKDAPVTIIAFSDYQCPFCTRGETTMNQVREAYGDQVRLVFRDFPLSFHANAQKAAEAGGCALEQGRFWELHDKMFANQNKLAVDDLKRYAGEVGLDAAKFNDCLDSGRRAEEVKKDMAEGSSFGVTGTPAFFVNGRFVSGAQPFDNFARLIDEELAFKGLPVPPRQAPKPAAPPAAAAPAPAPAPAPAVKPAPKPANG